MPGNSWDDDDDHSWDGGDDDSLSALDFSSPTAADDDWSSLDALDGQAPSAATDSEQDHSGLAGIDDYLLGGTASDDDSVDDFADYVIEEEIDEDSGAPALFSVTHPSQAITVKAFIGGRIQRVELAPEVSRMTEAQLTAAIMTTVKLASVKGRAAQRSIIRVLMTAQGVDESTVETFIDESVHLPTADQAAAAEAEVRSEYLRSGR